MCKFSGDMCEFSRECRYTGPEGVQELAGFRLPIGEFVHSVKELVGFRAIKSFQLQSGTHFPHVCTCEGK